MYEATNNLFAYNLNLKIFINFLGSDHFQLKSNNKIDILSACKRKVNLEVSRSLRLSVCMKIGK
jgi:hypothetical protein